MLSKHHYQFIYLRLIEFKAVFLKLFKQEGKPYMLLPTISAQIVYL